MRVLFILLFLAAAVGIPGVDSCAETITTQVVEVEGSAQVIGLDLARARTEAIRDALLKAVVQAANRFLAPREAEQKSTLLNERIYSHAEGFIQDYRLISESSVLDVYTVAMRVTVFTDGIRDELQGLGLTGLDRPYFVAAGLPLTIHGIGSYGDYARCYGILKARIPGIRAIIPREASWGQARFDIAVEEAIPTVAERLRERLKGEIRRQDEQGLEIRLR